MRRTAVILAVFMLSGALMGICACGKGATGSKNTGKVEGNFQTEAAGREQIENAAGDIDLKKSFGDREKEDWKWGMELSVALDAKIVLREVRSPMIIDRNVEGSGSFDYVLNFSKEDMKGSGTAKFNLLAKAPDEKWELEQPAPSYDVGVKLYNDRDDLYAKFDTLNVNDENHLAGGRTPDGNELEVLFEGLFGGLDEESFPSFQWMEEAGSLAELLEMLCTQYGAKVFLDASEGVRAKVSLDAKFFLGEVLQFIGSRIGADNFVLTKDTVDAYFAFDEGGMFKKLGFDLNLQASLEETSEAGGTLSMKGRLALIASSKKAVAPKDLASYPYVIPISTTIGSATPPKEEASHVIIEASAKADGLSSFTFSVKDGTIYFAPPKGQEPSASDWLKYTGDPREDLSVSFELTYTGDLAALTLSIEGLEKLLPCLALPHLYVNGTDIGLASINADMVLPVEVAPAGGGTINVTAVFSWGELFGGENPYNYFNALPYNKENGTMAMTGLNALSALKSERVVFAFSAVAA